MCVSLFRKTHFLHLVLRETRSQTPVLNKEKPAAFDLEQFLRNEAISLNCRSHRNIWNVLSSFLSIKRIAYFSILYSFSFFSVEKKDYFGKPLESKSIFKLIAFVATDIVSVFARLFSLTSNGSDSFLWHPFLSMRTKHDETINRSLQWIDAVRKAYV